MAAVIMANAIGGVQRIIGYTFNDTSIVWEAMQAAGSGVRLVGNRRIPDGNKRLAVLGDTILKLAIIEEWYNGGEARGTANQLVSTIGSNANLDRVGRVNGLDVYINSSPGQGHTISPVTMTAAVEAILGAVYLDSGMAEVRQVMQTLGL